MQKSPLLLIVITLVFISLIVGVFIGRNTAGLRITLNPSSGNQFAEEGHTQNSEEIGKVNINTAGVKQLTLLPGIGLTKAENIISFREEYGRFTRIEDLIYVDGFSYAIIEDLRPYITVGG